jgi:nucleotide-binding universal stress UspA family protein
MWSERPVVVGVDGSEAALAALDWAVGEAVERHRRLRVVHVFIWPLFDHVPLGPLPAGPPSSGLRAAAQGILDEAVRRASTLAPTLLVEGAIRTGATGPGMLSEADNAELVVVGSRGLGGFTGLMLGSVSSQLAAHSPCPVVVTRALTPHRGQPPGDTVVVGVEDPDKSAATIEFALAEANRLTVPLAVVSALPHTSAIYGVPLADKEVDEEVIDTQRDLLAAAVREWQPKFPDVEIRDVLVRDTPAHALINSSKRARLVVVGARGSGGFAGLRLGSVSQQVLHHASSPVAIVHHRANQLEGRDDEDPHHRAVAGRGRSRREPPWGGGP